MRTALGEEPIAYFANQPRSKIATVRVLELRLGLQLGSCGRECVRLWWAGGCANAIAGVPGRPRRWFGRLLHWEKQSGEDGQFRGRLEGCLEGRTLGGMRVERPRFCMKLILTATAQSASIARSPRSGSLRTTYQGGQDDGVEMEGVRSVVRFEEESCTTDYAGAFAKQPPQLHPVDMTDIHDSRPPPRRHNHHVCPTKVNCIARPRPCPAALCDEGHGPVVPHICDQRAHSPRPQDEL
jgi:hypothetical protein